jgi:hypothetical protein
MLRKTFLEKANRSGRNLQAIVLKNQERSFFWPITLIIILFLISICLLAFKFGSLPSQLPLYYSRPWGEAMLAKNTSIFILPGLMLILTVFDLVIYLRLVKSSAYLAKILLIATLVSSALLTWTLTKIVLLVS